MFQAIIVRTNIIEADACRRQEVTECVELLVGKLPKLSLRQWLILMKLAWRLQDAGML